LDGHFVEWNFSFSGKLLANRNHVVSGVEQQRDWQRVWRAQATLNPLSNQHRSFHQVGDERKQRLLTANTTTKEEH
jgi:hypothetical protein